MTSPEKIGRYKVISELGRGGMATVYAAIDPSFERQVAIKVLPRAFLHDPQFRARFDREAKTVAALEHAAIVPVYDFGEEDGMPFIVMRLMAGGSLADKLKDDKLSLDQAVRVILRLAPALDTAHEKGIIHRDLKPGNILFDQYNNAFLSDFGIARLAESGATLTGSNILGTPAYMSPEQVQGDKDLGGRSDLYSMGVIFYQMLIGHTPYQATTPAKVMMMHILEPVPDLMLIMPDVPPAVTLWLEKCLAKDPDDRFENALDMGAALETAMRGEIHPTLQSMPSPVGEVTQSATLPAAAATVMTPAGGMAPAIAPPYGRPPVAVAPKKKSRLLPITIGALALAGIGVIAVIGLVLMGISGSGPLSGFLAAPSETPVIAQATATQVVELAATGTEVVAVAPDPTATREPDPTETSIPVVEASPTATIEPTPTLTPTPDKAIMGGADVIAFVHENDIWAMNVDGTDLRQLTSDRGVKTNLAWTHDGSALVYISGKCVWTYDYEADRIDYLACFENAEYLDSFTISPDGSQVAISLNRELYIVPFDREALGQANSNGDLDEMSQCGGVSPYLFSTGTAVPIKLVRWSNDGTKLAATILIPESGILADAIRIIDVADCNRAPIRLDEFPATRFTIEGYQDTPYIQNFGFNGDTIFALVSYKRNDGYGDLYVYNSDSHKADVKVNPIDGTCCYRDIEFSPDGSFVAFAYQAFEPGATAELYYIRYATIGTGSIYEPLPLPEGFFSNIKERPQPVLRPAQ
jgi:hypothetical protein